jgi:hypothetical protein
VSALNETHDVDFTAEEENKKTAVPSELKRSKTKLLRNTGQTYGTFKRGTDKPERNIVPLWGH